jgi:endonuclease YncB( thermonuclease family)
MKYSYLLTVLILSACIPIEDSGDVLVDYVIDGDTFVTTDQSTIRIWGIDAPEKDEAFYETSRLTLETLILDDALQCRFIAKGKYRRDLMRCYIGDEDIAAIMVEKGMAKNYAEFPNDYYLTEEIEAQKSNLGIWKK